jgi:hypothetical protein
VHADQIVAVGVVQCRRLRPCRLRLGHTGDGTWAV